MLVAYPNQLPNEDLQIALDAMHGKIPDPKVAVHALYESVGFGLGVIYNDVPKPLVTFAHPKEGFKAVAEGKCKAEALPWTIFIPILLDIIQKILSSNILEPVK